MFPSPSAIQTVSVVSFLSTTLPFSRFVRCALAMLVVPLTLAEMRPAQAADETIATQIAPGGSHTCAVTGGGGVKCWGSNLWGQLGDGTTTRRTTPVDVVGLSNVREIAVGGSHTCALTNEGAVKCWGYNTYGQLGDASNTHRSTPVDVSGLNIDVRGISAGWVHTCARISGGRVMCWGGNADGKIGDGTSGIDRTTPVDVMGLGFGIIDAVVSGAHHNCLLTRGGTMKCWGSNWAGQLGDGTTIQRNSPVDVIGLNDGVTGVSAGVSNTCVTTSGGGAKCWGSNDHGQIGDGSTIDRSVPAEVSGLGSGVSAVSVGWRHACARTADGLAKCWGWNPWGQLGDGSRTERPMPVSVSGLANVSSIAVGQSDTCALTTDGKVMCWGNIPDGDNSYNSTMDRLTPVAVNLNGENASAGSSGGGGGCMINRNAGFDWSFVVMLLLGVGTRVLRRNGKMAGEARPDCLVA